MELRSSIAIRQARERLSALDTTHEGNERKAKEAEVLFKDITALDFNDLKIQSARQQEAQVQNDVSAIRPPFAYGDFKYYSKKKVQGLERVGSAKVKVFGRKTPLFEDLHLKNCKEAAEEKQKVERNMFSISTPPNCALVCGTDYQHHKDNNQIAYAQTEGYQMLSSGLWVAPPDTSKSESGHYGHSSISQGNSWGCAAGVGYNYGSSGLGDSGGYSGGYSGGGGDGGGGGAGSGGGCGGGGGGGDGGGGGGGEGGGGGGGCAGG
ncbi:uncharacterized protein PAC_17521 [Phialocephala subalpina]|uniref:Uncharacterized protein n=1 Tax=Phialocephala subalpina TaxID=576137 RepID=A0A1L7XRD5_9HELO|nr:uncharacterized protein PAC_17521 [Phialocephala subalpina]